MPGEISKIKFPINSDHILERMEQEGKSAEDIYLETDIGRATPYRALQDGEASISTLERFAQVLDGDRHFWPTYVEKLSSDEPVWCQLTIDPPELREANIKTLPELVDWLRDNRLSETSILIRKLIKLLGRNVLFAISVGSAQIRLLVSREEARKLIEKFNEGEFSEDEVVAMKIICPKDGDKKTTKSDRIWVFGTVAFATLSFVLAAILLFQIPQAGALADSSAPITREEVSVFLAGRPVVAQDSIPRRALLALTIKNDSKSSVMVDGNCMVDLGVLETKIDQVGYYLIPGQSSLIDPGEKATLQFANNGLPDELKNLEPKRNVSYAESTASVRLADPKTGEILFTKSVPVWILPSRN